MNGYQLWTVRGRVNNMHAFSSQDLRDVKGISLLYLEVPEQDPLLVALELAVHVHQHSLLPPQSVAIIANGETKLTSADHRVNSQETS